MKPSLCLILALTLLGTAPGFAAKGDKKVAKAAGPAATSATPSVELRGLIDATLPKLSNITNPNQKPIDRTKLISAQAEYIEMVWDAGEVDPGAIWR